MQLRCFIGGAFPTDPALHAWAGVEAVLKGCDLTLDQGIRLEEDLYVLLQTTHDRQEGINAFLEKRKPRFQGE